jgi:hypothetical protein
MWNLLGNEPWEYENPISISYWNIYPKNKRARSIVNGNWACWAEKDGIVSWVYTCNVPEYYFSLLTDWLIARHTNFI